LYSNFYLIILYPLIYIFPAYVANGAPVIFGRGRPLDFGRKFRGKRIFGDSKSRRGAVAGIACGIIVGAIEYPFFPYMLYISIALSLGAIFGDLLGSFIKRQLGMKPGRGVPILDQYGFFVLALLFALPLGHLPSAYSLLFLVLLTGPLHLLTNVCANRLKLKVVPW
jgi:CDP-2,3-bis-(O-geranylgeranyl)-sn-glycerol synthase